MNLPLLVMLAAAAPAGRYQGTVDVPGRAIAFTLDLAPAADGTWGASGFFTGLGQPEAPLADVKVTPPGIAFSFPDTGRGFTASFEGRLDGARITGTMKQAGLAAPFALERTGEPELLRPPVSTPIGAGAAGEWRGDYELLGYARHVTITLANQAGGPAKATFVIVGKRHNDLPVSLLRQEGDYVTVVSQTTGLTFEGRLVGEEWAGTLVQGGLEIPLTLRRTAGGAR